MFIIVSNIANYEGYRTLYACNKNINSIKKRLESQSLPIFKWFQNNHCKVNKLKIKAGGSLIYNETTVKLFSVTVYNKLSSEQH